MVSAGGFWPGEFATEMAVALEGIASQQRDTEPAAVDAILTLARHGRTHGHTGVGAIGALARRASEPLQHKLTDALAGMVLMNDGGSIEAIHQLIELGPAGIDRLVEIAADSKHVLRPQILSYSVVRRRLGLG